MSQSDKCLTLASPHCVSEACQYLHEVIYCNTTALNLIVSFILSILIQFFFVLFFFLVSIENPEQITNLFSKIFTLKNNQCDLN